MKVDAERTDTRRRRVVAAAVSATPPTLISSTPATHTHKESLKEKLQY